MNHRSRFSTGRESETGGTSALRFHQHVSLWQIACLLVVLILLSPQPGHADSQHYYAAIAHQHQGRYAQALTSYRHYLASNPFSVYKRLARTRLAVLEKGLQHNDQGMPHYLRALELRDQGKYSTAIDSLHKVLEVRDSIFASDARYLTAYIALMDQFQYQDAVKAFQQLLDTNPGAYSETALYSQALALEQLGQTALAREAFEALRERHSLLSFEWLGLHLGGTDYQSRLWFERANRRIEQIEERTSANARKAELLGAEFNLAIGARYSYDTPAGSGSNYQYSWNLFNQHQLPATHLTHWYTRSTDWRWESAAPLQAATAQGLTPVISHWWFGDEISPEFVTQNRDAYLDNIRNQLIPILNELQDAIVLLEPEFNKQGIPQWQQWDTVASEAISLIKHQAPHVKVGLTVGDWAQFNKSDFLSNIDNAVELSDFVGFMLMTSADNESADLNPVWSVRERVVRAARALKQRFNKPLFLGYAALSSANNWQSRQAEYLRQLLAESPMLAEQGVSGFGYFSLYDNPAQVGWFGDAENHFGMLSANGQDKPAAQSWRQSTRELLHLDRTPPLIEYSNILAKDTHIALDYRFSEWSRWQIELLDLQTSATREFRGAGNRLSLQWHGEADRGEFADGPVALTLTLHDKAGNPLRHERQFDYRCTRWCQHHSIALLPDNTKVSTRNATRFEWLTQQHLRASFLRPHSAILFHPPDWTPQARDRIRFQIKVNDNVQGLSLGLIDARHYQVTVPIQLLLPADATGWQTVSIAIDDLPANARRFGAGGKQVQFGTLAPDHNSKIFFEQRLDSTTIELRDIVIMRPQPGPSYTL